MADPVIRIDPARHAKWAALCRRRAKDGCLPLNGAGSMKHATERLIEHELEQAEKAELDATMGKASREKADG